MNYITCAPRSGRFSAVWVHTWCSEQVSWHCLVAFCWVIWLLTIWLHFSLEKNPWNVKISNWSSHAMLSHASICDRIGIIRCWGVLVVIFLVSNMIAFPSDIFLQRKILEMWWYRTYHVLLCHVSVRVRIGMSCSSGVLVIIFLESNRNIFACDIFL